LGGGGCVFLEGKLTGVESQKRLFFQSNNRGGMKFVYQPVFVD
jgi:hypothetical protein